MASPELIALIQKNDKAALKQAFELYYGRLAAIANRYAKNQSQAAELFNTAFNNCLHKLQQNRHSKTTDLDAFMEREFVLECVDFIKSKRSEYYVASTVYAIEPGAAKNYDLFESTELIDFNQVDPAVLVQSLQQLVPSQRLVFNLHVIEGYSIAETGTILETNEETIKSNFEKARYHLQKNIEHSLKATSL